MAIKFNYDKGNDKKNETKHDIKNVESESVFKDRKRKIAPDLKHSSNEKRYICIGKSNNGRILFLVYTKRKGRIRIISSRPGNKKDCIAYES